MRILILEDEEYRIEKFKQNFIGCDLIVTKSPEAANILLKKIEFDFIFLDHDLQEFHYDQDTVCNETTGLCTAEFLGNNLNLSPKAVVIIHSLNWSGRERMRQACVKRNPQVIPFTHLFERLISR